MAQPRVESSPTRPAVAHGDTKHGGVRWSNDLRHLPLLLVEHVQCNCVGVKRTRVYDVVDTSSFIAAAAAAFIIHISIGHPSIPSCSNIVVIDCDDAHYFVVVSIFLKKSSVALFQTLFVWLG